MTDHFDHTKGTCCEFAPDRGDKPAYLRHLKGSHADKPELIEAATQELAQLVRAQWAQVFQGGLKVDFVCVNPTKRAMLENVMSMSDILPLVFGLEPNDGFPDRFRVAIEL